MKARPSFATLYEREGLTEWANAPATADGLTHGPPQTLILIAMTVVVSWLAFERPRLLDRLIAVAAGDRPQARSTTGW